MASHIPPRVKRAQRQDCRQALRGNAEVKMKLMTVTITAFFLISTTWAQGQHRQNGRKSEHMQTVDDITMVVPALEKYAKGPLAELWKRPGLKPRDRSIVTIAALIASNQTIEMPYYFNLALDNGVKPREISEIITHLAFYSGMGLRRPHR